MGIIHVIEYAPSHRIIIFHSVMHVIRGMHDKHFISPVTVGRFIGGQGVILITYILHGFPRWVVHFFALQTPILPCL